MQLNSNTLYIRQQNFLKKIRQLGCSHAFITKKENIYYLTGLASLHPSERESFLLVSHQKLLLYHSPFVIPPTSPHINFTPMSPTHTLQSVMDNFFVNTDHLGVEKDNLTVSESERIEDFIPAASLIAIDAVFKELRLIKDAYELFSINKACDIANKAMDWIREYTTSAAAIGISESELARMLEHKLFELGAANMAFPTIVAFDSHTASPHHVSGQSKLTKKSIVLIDMGADVAGYKSDMTRTWCLSSPPSEFSKVEKLVKQAYSSSSKLLGLNSTHLTASLIDKTARNIITKAGYGDRFIHTTGHGIGLEAHETPSINSNNDQQILPGMVITIEPGIYLPGHFGYRHENTFIIKN